MSDKLIIVASAPCVIDDLNHVPDHSRFDFMAINHDSPAFLRIGHIKYVVSYEDVFIEAKRERGMAGLNTDFISFSNQPHPGVNHVLHDLYPPECPSICHHRFDTLDPRNNHFFSGTSTLLGVKVGLRLGYKKIIIVGAPLQGEAIGGSDPDRGHYEKYQKGWIWIADLLKCCPVRSMSGFTRDLLGEYTEEWLNG